MRESSHLCRLDCFATGVSQPAIDCLATFSAVPDGVKASERAMGQQPVGRTVDLKVLRDFVWVVAIVRSHIPPPQTGFAGVGLLTPAESDLCSQNGRDG